MVNKRRLGLIIILVGFVFFIGALVGSTVIFENNSHSVKEEHLCYDKYGRVIEGLKCYETKEVLNEDAEKKNIQAILGILMGFGLVLAIIGALAFAMGENEYERTNN